MRVAAKTLQTFSDGMLYEVPADDSRPNPETAGIRHKHRFEPSVQARVQLKGSYLYPGRSRLGRRRHPDHMTKMSI